MPQDSIYTRCKKHWSYRSFCGVGSYSITSGSIASSYLRNINTPQPSTTSLQHNQQPKPPKEKEKQEPSHSKNFKRYPLQTSSKPPTQDPAPQKHPQPPTHHHQYTHPLLSKTKREKNCCTSHPDVGHGTHSYKPGLQVGHRTFLTTNACSTRMVAPPNHTMWNKHTAPS